MRAPLTALALTALSAPALAQSAPCGPYDAIAEQLHATFDEAPIGRGLDTSGLVMELWVAKDGATWTALLVRADGIACMARAGEAWGEITGQQLPGLKS